MLYNLIKSQFPDHVRAQYPAFIAFVSAYYKWLEIRFSQRLENIVDIDATTDIVYVKRVIGTTNISANPFINEIIAGETSGAKAIVKRYTTSDNHYTFYIKYISNVKFVDDELVYVEKIEGSSISSISTRTIDTNCVSTVAGDFITYFRSYLDVDGIFDAVDIHTAKYLKNIKDVYSAKGSEQALVFLLNSIHNTKANILYPNENILRASDGRWNQESFITVRVTYGSIPDDPSEIFIKSDSGTRKALLTRVEILESTVVRLYYDNTQVVKVKENDIVQFRNANNIVICQAVTIRSPSSIKVEVPGKNWRIGQIVTIPGTIKDTIARVTQVDSIGRLLSLDIIEYGYNHIENQSLTISPYSNIPIIADITLIRERISINPSAYNYTLNINDGTKGILEELRASSKGYFAQDYAITLTNNPYNLNAFYIQRYEYDPNEEIIIQEEDQDWIESQATIVFNYGVTMKLAGKWSDDSRGQISNQQIVLQDNFYYQQFSYVIDSELNPNEYMDLALSVHPAGMKMFTKTNLQTVESIQPSAFSETPKFTKYILDNININDSLGSFSNSIILQDNIQVVSSISKSLRLQTLEDSFSIQDQVSNVNTSPGISDSSSVTDSITNFTLNRVISDSSEVQDSISNVLTITISDEIESSDELQP